MAQRPKAKPKRKGQKGTDKKQSERFKEAARKTASNESGQPFERVLTAILSKKTEHRR